MNPKLKTNYWNTSVQIWLKDAIYDNIVKSAKSANIAMYATFLVSAFWHGIHLTYYVGKYELK